MSDDKPERDYASPVCLAGEIAPDYFDPGRVDERAAADADRWRKAERARLIAARGTLDEAARAARDAAIAAHLDRVLAERFSGATGKVLAGYWPIRGEPDLRGWMAALTGQGLRLALPVVVSRDAALIFRPWTPDAAMRAGLWNIPEPDTDEVVQPDLMLAPTVGWDSARYRMGYGGGFYDRSLASLRRRPYAIGVGEEAGRLRTIYPQPHDEPLDLIVTEAGII
ncbi:5-formyltetrahydrofolate cyclo-ligase [Paracoccus sp. SCSIO 75233]|uniref:5-formyltetrahydrofolate cyclo-ligase n=1 Tax=Paracoccus sp. SCSIO 75233 TaxID=3017782 RepID=UPI0022F00A5B|nr:5-formyltetrahydrofolate cyclo-ligase [Paracoccus sp. SCSIO 75233]WBU53603.1 5-formyltetrahydrofolate cyclo-ligase [Paracoccus sp. SCSIO 75233]